MNPSSLVTRIAVAVSVIVHAAAVAVSLGYAGAGLYASAPEAVPVSLVTPEEIPPAAAADPPPPQELQPDLSKLDLRLTPLENRSQQQALPSEPVAKPQANKFSKPAKAPPAAAASPQPSQPAYTPPQPDISLRYQIDLGLKDMAAAPAIAAPRGGSADFDDAATAKADIDATNIAAFRRQLAQCATLPASVDPDDKVVIVIRANFTPDARLAAAPMLIEASASAKGPALMEAAIAALQTCQPFTTLPSDKFAEWRVLDLRFTPRDFKKG
jgi:hypothetical protein